MTEQTGNTLMEEHLSVDLLAPGAPGDMIIPDEAAFDDFVSHYEDAGVTWASFTVCEDFHFGPGDGLPAIARARRYFLDRPERFVFVESMGDVRRAKADGKLAVSLHFQGSKAVGRDLNLVEAYKKLGVHHMLLCYNQKNDAGDGCHERTDGGLSRFGISLVEEMNRVGMVVDASHTGYETTMDIFEVSNQPVIFSHSSCRDLFDHERNVWDDQIVACARSGGVIGITGIGLFMSQKGDDISADAIIAHIEHAIELVGAEHVGLGLDWVQNTRKTVEIIRANTNTFTDEAGSYDIEELYSAGPGVIVEIADGLLQRNYSELEVRGIIGQNWVDLFESIIG
jgi:membrane dipeptidase